MKLLYMSPLPEVSQTSERTRFAEELSKSGTVSSEETSVADISSKPADLRLEGQYRWGERFSGLLAKELSELADAAPSPVPLSRQSGDGKTDGYYTVEQADVTPVHPNRGEVWQYDISLTENGTHRSHWRAVKMNLQTVDNPYSSETAPEIGLSIRARKVRWFDPAGGAVADATAQRRVEGEHDYLDIYDASEPPFDAPALIYDIPYTQEYPTDCTVWDTLNRPKLYEQSQSGAAVGSAAVGEGVVSGSTEVRQWQKVYSPSHDWRGDAVLETDRLRLVIDQPEDVLRAYRWSPTDGQWALVQLGASDWRLYDIDITQIGLARIETQLEFEDLSTGDRHSLNATLLRGLDEAVVTVPPNESTPPQDLLDRLAPIAATTDRVPAPTQDVIKRTEVDR